MSLSDAIRRRRSRPVVTGDAPSTEQLIPLIELAATSSDHGLLRPWRTIQLRGDARERLGAALVEASGLQGSAAEAQAAKPLRAPLLLAIVVCYRESVKVTQWEQDAAAAGVAHILSLLLDDAGWGVMWRSGRLTRSEPVRKLHRLADTEQLLGWLYVGGRTDQVKPDRPALPKDYLTSL